MLVRNITFILRERNRRKDISTYMYCGVTTRVSFTYSEAINVKGNVKYDVTLFRVMPCEEHSFGTGFERVS